MWKKSKVIQDIPDFKKLISEYSDEEILNILKKRKHYQADLAELAVQEAIKRGIIHSEQDLFAEEFLVKPLNKTFFPLVENERNRKKLTKSIARGLLISGLIPTVFGFLKINEGNTFEGGILTFGGVLWIILAAQIIRKVNHQIINLFFILLLLSAVFNIKLWANSTTFVFMDVFIFTIIYCLIIYGLIYIRRLNS